MREVLDYLAFEGITDEDLAEVINKDLPPIIEFKMKNIIKRAKEEPKMIHLFGNYISSGQVAILGGDTGVGKTILSYDAALHISKGKTFLGEENEAEPLPVLYLDYELSRQSLLKRFPNENIFDDYFHRPDIDDLILRYEGEFNIDQIINCIDETNASFVVIDNISAVALKSTQDADTALQLIKAIHFLSRERKLTFLLIAHTPKILPNQALSINHISGSKILSNFADSVFMIGRSNQSINRRYIKLLKTRDTIENESVLVADIEFDGYLRFTSEFYDEEKHHLSLDPDKDSRKRNDLISIAEALFHGGPLRYSEFCDAYAKEYNKSPEMGKKIHNELKSKNMIIKLNNSWIINRNEITEME
jgi:predicted ATP-dependent serine protease